MTFFWCSHRKKSELFVEKLKHYAKASNSTVKVVDDGNIKILSSELIGTFKEYFKIRKKPESWQLEYEGNSEREYGIHKAKLKRSKFNTNDKKLMFLSGVIMRYGEFVNETVVELKFANSPNHYDATTRFLKRLKFEILDFKDCDKNMVPCTRTIKFLINNKYKSEFEKIKQVIAQIEPDMNDCK